MKKFFSILFSIYFISLIAMPCGDKDSCNEIKNEQTSSSDQKKDHSDEACNPFCICSCCATHFLVKDFQPELNQVAEINTVYTVHKEAETSSAICSIWQPPQLS